MLHVDSRIRLKGTKTIGTIIDFEPGSDHCTVDPDLSYISDGSGDPFEVDLSELDELVEASEYERHSLFDSFDLIKLDVSGSFRLANYCQLFVERVDGGYLVHVAHMFKREDESPALLEGEDATRLRFEDGKMKAFRWTEPFEPKGYMVLDGYSWIMEVYSGNRFFSCSGDNVTPQELIDFVDYVASLGLPRIDVFD